MKSSLKSLSKFEETGDYFVRSMLRDATQHEHVRLNQHPMLKGLTQPGYKISAYFKLLSLYLTAYTVVEERICRFLERQPAVFDYSGRYKTPWLKCDLEFFHGYEGNAFVLTSQGINFPEFESKGELIGGMYVVEGATLGGRVISRSLADFHGLASDT